MKTFNITPKNLNKQGKSKDKRVELVEFNMQSGDNLKFTQDTSDEQYFRVNINFKSHRISRVMCLN